MRPRSVRKLKNTSRNTNNTNRIFTNQKPKVMKLTKLMLSVCVAALVLASCNKNEHTPDLGKGMKSIELKISNTVFTKGDGGGAIPADKSVVFNDLRIYLTDATYTKFYDAMQSDGTTPAETYWEGTDLTDLLATGKIDFHYVDPAVKYVIAVGNMGNTPYADVNKLKEATLKVGEQQNHAALSLYGVGEVTTPSGTHPDAGVTNNVYQVSVTLKPRISRFEVAGFRVAFADTPKYSEIEILQLAFDDYMPETVFNTGEEAGTLVDAISTDKLSVSNSTDVYTWLAGNNQSNVWWYDVYAPGTIELTPTAPVKDIDQRAYHFFAGEDIPQFVIHLTADGVPAYIYTKRFMDNQTPAQEITKFEEGTIYRMSAEGEVADSDGTIEIPEDKIDLMDRCLDITVEVESWVVTLVTPEF